MNYLYELIEYINSWQKENDIDFKVLPIDEHSHLIFNYKNQIYDFIFSNKIKREKCRLSIPQKLLDNYQYAIEQENGFTFYYLAKGDL